MLARGLKLARVTIGDYEVPRSYLTHEELISFKENADY